MRKIYIHIGCGKTGSSALQVWLNRNADFLKQRGVMYPRFRGRIENDYEITNGNGAHAVEAVRAGDASQYFESLLISCPGDILLSSEAFQMLEKQELVELYSIFERLNVLPIVIAYVRDLYDILNSGYHQLVKRHRHYKSFDSLVYSLKGIHQFQVLDLWASCFPEMMVLHYDSEKSNLDYSFLRALGVDADDFPRMSEKTVNRSLSLIEIEILKLMNRLFVEKYGDTAKFSAVISDMFIYKRPEEKSYIFYDEKIEDFLLEKFGKNISEINQKYFDGQDVLRVFRQEGKNIATEPYVLPQEFIEAVEALMSIIETVNIEGIVKPRSDEQDEQKPLKISDPRIVDILREAAIRRESADLTSALELMTAARVLRPQGVVINQKLVEYKAKLGVVEG